MTRSVRLVTAIALAASLGAGACAKKKPAPPPAAPAAPPVTQPTTPPPPPTPPAPPPPAPRTPSDQDIFNAKTLDQLNAEKPLDDAFFALDSSEISGEARSALQKDAEWMKRWTSTKVMVEGHCDSRGTAEYNLALGDKRAAAVRDYLVSLGVDASRVQTVSKGKEQPFCNDENDACWQQNRRGHFLITAK